MNELCVTFDPYVANRLNADRELPNILLLLEHWTEHRICERMCEAGRELFKAEEKKLEACLM